jgi:hypothetical protein
MAYRRRITGLAWLDPKALGGRFKTDQTPSDAPEPPEDQTGDERKEVEEAEETEPEN